MHADSKAGVPRFDHGVFADGQTQPFTGFDAVVTEVAVTRQPDAAFEHRQLAAEAPEVDRLTRCQRQRGVGPGPAGAQFGVRIHHQSPAFGAAIIGVTAGIIQ
ncbi:MAG: hypothetical protein Q8R33_06375 [Burkholderiales bacterium]|nr:hypothetical protein [Burkholderiales bacterium]